MTTLLDVKIASLQKMNLIDGDSLIENTTTNPYLKAMPSVIDEALQTLATAGKYIVKDHVIVQDGTGTGIVQRYDFKTLVSDFYDFRDAYFEDEKNYGRVTISTEGKGVFILPTTSIGTWKVYYNAYPQSITKDTPNDTVLLLDPEIVALIPIYVASELMREDEPSLATDLRNKFEVGFGRLVQTPSGGQVAFYSESGW
ncbi:MAG TPA: hypothetical protein VN631_12320 [Negativicutes bacterium]|nr:hypothetical protein [Negativicutes bacterium]